MTSHRLLLLLVPLLLAVAVAGPRPAAASFATTQVYMSNRNCQGDPDAFVFAPWPTPTNSSTCVPTPCSGVVANAPGASQSRACTSTTATPFFSSYALLETFASAACTDAAPNSTLAARLGTCVPAVGSSNRFLRLSCLDVLGTTVTVAVCNDAACSVCPILTTATAGACTAGVRYSCPVIYVMSLWFWVAVGGGALVCVVGLGITICCCRRCQQRKREEEGFDNVVRVPRSPLSPACHGPHR
jgi:hypothetical protein